MTSQSIMERFLEESEASGPRQPFWTLDLKNEDELLRWLVAEVDALEEQAKDRVLIQRKNLAAYRGIHYNSQDTRTRESESVGSKGKNPRVVMNHMLDMVEQAVSRVTKYPAAVNGVPASEDYDDKIVAELGEDLITAVWDKAGINALMQKMHRRSKIFGEDFIVTEWDETLGDYHPDWVAEVFAANGIQADPRKMSRGEIRDTFRKRVKTIPPVPVVDPETGDPVLGEDGRPLQIDRPVRLGDIRYRLYLSWNVLLQRREKYEDVEYGFLVDLEDVDGLKADYPRAAHKISRNTSHSDATHFDTESLQEIPCGHRVKTYTFYHRKTSRLDQGRKIRFTRDAILLNVENPYRNIDGARLPWRRLVDIEAPGLLNGEASVTQGRPAQAVYNNVTSLLVRDMFLFAHPKWFVPQGSVKLQSLGNDTAIAQYTGAVPPTLSQPMPSNMTHFQLRDAAKRDFEQIMGVFGVSRGEPPAGVNAGIALQFLEEQENERNNPMVARHLDLLKGLAHDTAAILSDFYDDDEGRLEALLGRTRASQVKHFRMADLVNVADFKVTTGSSLPQQKSARLQYILEMKKNFPTIMPDDQVVDLLDLGEVEKFRNIATTAVRSADAENDSLMKSGAASPPEPWEQHVVHYRSHLRLMNDPGFDDLPENIKSGIKEHVMAHEMFMWKIGQKVPQFTQAVVAEFPAFPVLFVAPEPMPMLQQQAPPAPMNASEAGAPAPMPGEVVAEASEQVPPGMDQAIPMPSPETIAEPEMMTQ